MAERAEVFERRVLVPVAVIVLLVLAGAVMMLGPGRSAVLEARARAEQKERRIANWREQRASTSQIGAEERASWQEEYERFASLPMPNSDEASMARHVATIVSAPTLNGLELTPLRDARSLEGDAVQVREPFGSRQFELTRLPMRVRFDVEYRDLFPILSRLQSREHGLVLTKAAFQRHFPGVRVDLEVEVWVRDEVTT